MNQTMISADPVLDQVRDELVASAPQPLSFAPTEQIRAFLLNRPTGKIAIYSTGELASEGWAEHEEITRQYLSHRHEAMFAATDLGTQLFVHERERPRVAETLNVRGTFSRRHRLDDDFEVIPIPGHTSGTTAYLWDSGHHRYLFTGDSLMLDRDRWHVAVLESSDREAYLESLALIRELEFDVLVPWAASREGPAIAFTDRADRERRLEAIIDRVRRGANR